MNACITTVINIKGALRWNAAEANSTKTSRPYQHIWTSPDWTRIEWREHLEQILNVHEWCKRQFKKIHTVASFEDHLIKLLHAVKHFRVAYCEVAPHEIVSKATHDLWMGMLKNKRNRAIGVENWQCRIASSRRAKFREFYNALRTLPCWDRDEVSPRTTLLRGRPPEIQLFP